MKSNRVVAIQTIRFDHFFYYLSLEKGVVLHFNKIKSPLPKDALYQVLLKYWTSGFC